MSCRSGRTGFTLIELLVVIAVVALLTSILLPSLRGAMQVCRQVRELGAAQQLMVAYTMYADDNAGSVLPGYITDGMAARGPAILDDQGQRITGEPAKRYPWRLAPYLGYNFSGFYQDELLLSDIRDRDDFRYVVSTFPSFGVNGLFVGGRAGDGFAFDRRFEPVFGRFYVRRLDEVRRPDRLITFAAARSSQTTGVLPDHPGNIEGYFETRAPIFDAASGFRWQERYDARATSPGANSGFVSLRRLSRSVTAHIDGHASALEWDDLRDMTRWSDQATDAAWGLVPQNQ